DLLITGVSRNTLLTSHYGRLERRLQDGCSIRVLLVDPESASVETAANRYYADQNVETLRERIRHSLRLLSRLQRTTDAEPSRFGSRSTHWRWASSRVTSTTNAPPPSRRYLPSTTRSGHRESRSSCSPDPRTDGSRTWSARPKRSGTMRSRRPTGMVIPRE